MGMTTLPPDELATLMPFYPSRILEFGNKRNSSGTYREFYDAQFYACIDWNGKDGALPLDCNHALHPSDISTNPLDAEGFKMVTNFGFSEHVQNQPAFWKNVHDLTRIGGILVGVTPAPGHWPRHGILQPELEFYAALAQANGYHVVNLWRNEDRRRHTICYRFVKTQNGPFVMPDNWEDLIIPTPEPTQTALQNSGLA